MILAIARKEFAEALHRSRFVIGAVATFALVLGGVLLQVDDFARRRARSDENRIAAERMREEAEDPREAARDATAERPLAPLRVLVTGVERGAPETVRVGPGLTSMASGAMDTNPVLDLFPPLDLAYLVGVVGSLMVFVFAYDAVSGEREEGTLQLVFSYPVGRASFLAGKALGGMASVASPFVAAFLAAALVLEASPEVPLGAVERASLAVLGVVCLLFVAVCYGLGLSVSCLCRRSATSIAALGGVWVLLALVLPNLSPFVARAIYSAPSENADESVAARVRERHRAAFNAERRERRRAIREGTLSQEEAIAWRRKRHAEVQEAMEAEVAAATGPGRARRRSLSALTLNLCRLSPVAVFEFAVARLAQTGLAHEVRLQEALEAHRRELRRALWDDVPASGLPRFELALEPFPARLAGALPEVLILAVEAVLCFLVARVGFLRMDLL